MKILDNIPLEKEMKKGQLVELNYSYIYLFHNGTKITSSDGDVFYHIPFYFRATESPKIFEVFTKEQMKSLGYINKND